MQASPFDDLAADYDRSFTRSACGGALRSRVRERLMAVFGAGGHLLELGCGTGEDAIYLARAGHRVLAIDASGEMIRIARLKAAAAGVADRVEFRELPMESLHTLPRGQRFDGVFSNFGALNCSADVPALARALCALLTIRAPLLWVIMGRYVPWEWAWYLARGDRRQAFRRLRNGGSEWRGLTIHYPTPGEMSDMLAPRFVTERCTGLGFALPPSYAAGWLDRSPRALAVLNSIESATSRFTAGLSDHYIFEGRLRELAA